jgi:deoxyribose-phosphate aldolase
VQEILAIITAVLDAVEARMPGGARCTAEPCYDPLCPVHARADLDRLRSATWEPPAGTEPWVSLQRGTLDVASVLDHTILRPDATAAEIETGCLEARKLGCAAFCANPLHVPLVARLLKGSPVRVCTVVGFPLGATPTSVKVQEARWVLSRGAQEIDMVIPVGLAKGRQHREVFEDIREVTRATHDAGAHCKVILETALLSDEEKITVCLLAARAGADFVKTSTGYSKSGATAEDVSLMRLVVGDSLGVKAAGGIRTLDQALTMIRSGANRIGTSSSPAITGGHSSKEEQ